MKKRLLTITLFFAIILTGMAQEKTYDAPVDRYSLAT
jgi:hypothetical protein